MGKSSIFFVFFCCVFFSTSVYSQTCWVLSEMKVDKFQNDTTYSSKIEPFKNNNLTLYLNASWSPNRSRAGLSFIALDQGCIGKHPSIIFLFKDGSKLSLEAGNEFNCDGVALMFFRKSEYDKKQLEDLQLLQSKLISAVRITLYKSYFDYDFTDDQAKSLQNTLTCIYSKAIER